MEGKMMVNRKATRKMIQKNGMGAEKKRMAGKAITGKAAKMMVARKMMMVARKMMMGGM